MVRISLIDDELSVYKNNKVILFGAGYKGHQVKKYLERYGICIDAFVDNDPQKYGKQLDGVDIIAPDMIIGQKDVIVQISCDAEIAIENQLEELGVEKYISMAELYQRLNDIRDYKFFSSYRNAYDFIDEIGIWDSNLPVQDKLPLCNHIKDVLVYNKQPVLLAMPPKTGDWTLNASLSAMGVSYANLWHSMKRFMYVEDILKEREVKIVTAVREPISQNISIFFHMLPLMVDDYDMWRDGGKIEPLFEKFLHFDLYNNSPDDQFRLFKSFKQKEGFDYTIQTFFDKQFKPFCGIDLYDEEFDKEAGFSIFHFNNLQIFVFQIEKLNQISKYLANFLKLDELPLKNENIGADKWYRRTYNKALAELELQSEYFYECMNSKVLNNFYSEKDILSTREKWEKHVV